MTSANANMIITIVLALVGFLVLAIGYFFKRNETQHKESQQALATQSTALAVLVEQVQPSIKIVNEVLDLKLASAVLNQRVTEIEEHLRTRV